jgi:hypothetical protein
VRRTREPRPRERERARCQIDGSITTTASPLTAGASQKRLKETPHRAQ